MAEKCESPIWDDLRNEIMPKVEKNIDKLIEVINERGVSPESHIKQVFYNICSSRAESGEYHIYRGQLDTMGHEYLKLTKFLLSELVAEGVVSEEGAKEEMSIITENIRLNG